MFARPKQVFIFCDGSTGALDRMAAERSDPMSADGNVRRKANGRCAAAAVALDAEGHILVIEWQVLPDVTNNEAEYAGLLLGIEIARRLRSHQTVFVLDSETVVCQMTGRCGVNSPRLKAWHLRACTAVRSLSSVRYHAIPREYNRLADGAACQAAIAWEEILRAVGEKPGGS